MTPHDWTRLKINRLLVLGRSGMRWEDIAKHIGAHAETCRRKWVDVSMLADQRARDLARISSRFTPIEPDLDDDDDTMTFCNDSGIPDGVYFTDHPNASRPEYGRIPAFSTPVYQESTAALAALDIDE